MKLKGSCHCGAVHYECESKHPCPYQLCYCSICRKTTGGGGFSINIGGDTDSLVVTGEENITIYQAKFPPTETKSEEVSGLRRRFCKICGSALWFDDDRWPELIHPVASSIDTELPVPPERTHLMLGSAPAWVVKPFGPKDKKYEEYPEESLADWHKRLGLEK
ncbi:hypothetical protein R1sor_021571 [Riccia sorocarpa]|uniref:CENP-V/GFA domain-containing protein n=1 Tax=Riccia sorocarpa TaxID=122646 RepID=A0ABD3GHE7_9MARC